ncbi:MAG: hypothetical protein HC878_11320 [Leptolyngbyaceae cyanobacterium SL_5_14]|nr:hypothetical protein [Leptolyngbyaceae cyanobacterium SL_5_14]
MVVTVIEASGGVARRSGDRGGAVVRGDRLGREVEWLGAIGGVIQLTTPVQRIDQSRLGCCKSSRNR